MAAAPSAASTPASRTPETGTSTNGAAAATAAVSAREIRRRPSGKCARRAATITKNAQIAAKPSGRKRARCRRGSGQSGRDSRPPGDGRTPSPDSVSALDNAGSSRSKSGASTRNRTRRPFSVRNQPSASARRTILCRAASPSLSLCPRARTGRALGLPLASTVTSSSPAGPKTARTPGTAASRRSASPSACRLAASYRLSTSTSISVRPTRPKRAPLCRPRTTAGACGGAQAKASSAARAGLTTARVTAKLTGQQKAAIAATPRNAPVFTPTLSYTKLGVYRTKVAARETATLRSTSASERILLSSSISYSSRRCVFSRYGPSVLIV